MRYGYGRMLPLSFSIGRVAPILASLACIYLTSCASQQSADEKPRFTCPSKLSKALAFSHLKEAYVSLGSMTVEAAEEALVYTTDGLSCAPPHGNARAATVARLLVVRAQASATLDNNEPALVDLEAALAWAEQGRKDDPLLVPEIHLTRAILFLRVQQHDRAAESAAHARTWAERLGRSAAGLQCEALLFEGDLAMRRPRSKYPAEGYFRRIFDVAKRYEYPEEVWQPMESAAARLDQLSANQKSQLMGPVPTLRAQKIEDTKESRVMKRRGAKRAPSMVRVSKGRIVDADVTVAAMRAGFRRCYGRTSTGQSGRAVLSISVGAGGQVENVSAKSEDMAQQTLDCLKKEALRAQFNPPESDHAILHVPVTLIEQ